MQKNQNPTSLYDKSPRQTCIEGPYVHIIKAIYDKNKDDIILNVQNLKSFPGSPLLPFLLSRVLEILARAIGKRNEQKGYKQERRKLNYPCL
jgi:hypothetical protein